MVAAAAVAPLPPSQLQPELKTDAPIAATAKPITQPARSTIDAPTSTPVALPTVPVVENRMQSDSPPALVSVPIPPPLPVPPPPPAQPAAAPAFRPRSVRAPVRVRREWL